MGLIYYRKITYIISGTLVLLSLAALLVWGLQLGIDFTGGSLLEVEYTVLRPSLDDMNSRVTAAGIPHAVIQPTGGRGVLIRTGHLSEERNQDLVRELA